MQPNGNIKDEELAVQFIEKGDAGSFSLLVDRNQKSIYHRCLNYVQDKDVAEDLCQEVLIKLYLQLKSFRRQAKFSTWLFSITHNTCVDYLRKNKKNVTGVITRQLADQLADMVEEDDEIPRELSMQVLDQLLDQLNPEDKMLLLMKYKEKYAIKDIQRTLGISESAIKMRLKRAREKLNNLYQKLS